VKTGYFDKQYIFFGTTKTGQLWQGLVQSNIYYTGKHWRIQSLHDPNYYLENDRQTLPLGRQVWTTGPETILCGETGGFSLSLTFSICFPNQFTCNNGFCIDLKQRCDNLMDCEDKSDELDCQYVVFDSGYLKHLIPTDESGTQPIFINVTLKTFPNIDSVGLQFTADFYLNMRWYDSRLTFHNLVHNLIIVGRPPLDPGFGSHQASLATGEGPETFRST
jgi:hypothetical protein